MDMMRIYKMQPGRLTPCDARGLPRLTVDPGSAAVGTERCINLRRHSDQELAATGQPVLLATLPHDVDFTDHRAGRTHLFAVTPELRLILLGYTSEEEPYVQTNSQLGVVPAPVKSASQAGEFLVLQLTDNRLYYLLWHPDQGRYSVPGLPPEIATPAVERLGSVTRSVTIPAIAAGSGVADLRPGVPESLAAKVSAALSAATAELATQVRMLGYWLQPVVVRVGARLWNGDLVHLSSPRLVPQTDFVGNSRVAFAVNRDGDSVTSLGPASLQCSPYRISVATNVTCSDEWSDIIRHLEVWVSEERSAVDYTRAAAVAYNEGSDAVWANMLLRPTSELVGALGEDTMRLAALIPFGNGSRTVTLANSSAARQGKPEQPDANVLGIKPESVAAQGGFLYMGNVSTSYPLPDMPSVAPNPTGQVALCRVSVTLQLTHGRQVVSRTDLIPLSGGRLVPYLHYPSSRAVQMSIEIREGQGECYAGTFALENHGSGDEAWHLPDTLQSVSLDATDDVSLIAGDEQCVEVHSPGAVYTMKRGNPFVVAGHTEEVGSAIAHICAQRQGGGAYTRQYVYLFTGLGVAALVHDYYGLHRNVRMISGLRTRSGEHVAAAEGGVHFISSNDSLVTLRDATAERRLRTLPPVRALAYDSRHDELWLLPEEGAWSLVLDLGRRPNNCMEGSLRSYAPLRLVSRDGVMLFTAPWGGNCRLYQTERPGSPRADPEWVSLPMEMPQASPAMLQGEFFGGDDLEPTLSLRIVPDRESPDADPAASGLRAVAASCQGPGAALIRMPLLSPLVPAPGLPTTRRCRIVAAGCFRRMKRPTLTGAVNRKPLRVVRKREK